MINQKLQTIWSEEAKRMLETSPGNRPINRRKIERFKSDMRLGRWKVTHQGIAFDEKGRLIDGHHRLMAIMEGGQRVDMLVMSGVPRSAAQEIDVGPNRSGYDQACFMEGAKAPKIAEKVGATAVRRVSNFAVLCCVTGNPSGLGTPRGEDIEDVCSFYGDSLMHVVSLAKKTKHVMVSETLASLTFLHGHDPSGDLDDFIVQVAEGTGLEKDDPALTLRTYLLERGRKTSRYSEASRVIRAFWAHRDGRKMKTLSVGRSPGPLGDILGIIHPSLFMKVRARRGMDVDLTETIERSAMFRAAVRNRNRAAN